MLWTYILLRVVANPLSNVFQKLLANEGVGPLFIVGITHGLLSVVFLPVLLLSLPISPSFWLQIGICAVLAIAGNALLVYAVRLSDLSILGPINAYKSVVSIVPGVILLHEMPSYPELAGVLLIVIGSYLIVDKNDEGGRKGIYRLFGERGVQFRVAALVVSGLEAVFLKRALPFAPPLTTFAAWCVLGFLVSLGAVFLFDRSRIASEIPVLRENPWTCVKLATTTGVMQLSTIIIFTGFQVAAALALFQASTLLLVVFGWKVFGEKDFARRLLGSAVMVAGSILIVLTH